MRSLSLPPNHQSPCRRRPRRRRAPPSGCPASSVTAASSTTLPVTPAGPSQRSMPCASVVPLADGGEALGLAHAVVGVEAADHARAVRVDLAREGVDLHRGAGDRRARDVDHGDARADRVARRPPSVGRDRRPATWRARSARVDDTVCTWPVGSRNSSSVRSVVGVVAGFRSVMVVAPVPAASSVSGRALVDLGARVVASSASSSLAPDDAFLAPGRWRTRSPRAPRAARACADRSGARTTTGRPPAPPPARYCTARSTGTVVAPDQRRRRQLERRPSSAARGTPRPGSCRRSNRRCWRTSCRTPRRRRRRRRRSRRGRRPSPRSGSGPRSSRAWPRAGSSRCSRRRRASSKRERQLVVLVAADVDDRERGRPLARGGGAEAAQAPGAEEVLHVHRLAGAEERTVENGVGGGAAVLVDVRQLVAPGLDALVPARVHEAQVVAAARGHQEAVVELAQRAASASRRRGRRRGGRWRSRSGSARSAGRSAMRARPCRVGGALPHDAAVAVADGHLRARRPGAPRRGWSPRRAIARRPT